MCQTRHTSIPSMHNLVNPELCLHAARSSPRDGLGGTAGSHCTESGQAQAVQGGHSQVFRFHTRKYAYSPHF